MIRSIAIAAGLLVMAAAPAFAQDANTKIRPYAQTMTLTPSAANPWCNPTVCQFLFPDIGGNYPNLVIQYVSVHYSLSATSPETEVWMKSDLNAAPVLWLPTPGQLGGASSLISTSIFLVASAHSKPYVVVQGPYLSSGPVQVTLTGYYANQP